ncbi:MAG: DEAD/DEAH box helicase [Patescibacteria group bacterium]|nr:DEAD/DEAH box helicase [Patescibacteria group bacterium]
MPQGRFSRNRSRFSGKSRPFNQNRRFARPPQKRGGFAAKNFSDLSAFINKAVITEEVEKFIPEHRFEDFALVPALKANLKTKGYTDPTPIQDRTIPHIMRGEDVVGIANTGTGKTAAFLVPLINKLAHHPARVLIMVPTRELAVQIDDELRAFARGMHVKSSVCVGGININPQISSLKLSPQFVIGTPGRLKDLLERRALKLGDFSVAVLDEADRMLDMGFVHDMRKILALLPRERQTLFFSATLGAEVERLISEFLRTPVRVAVKVRETSATIDQDVVRVPQGTDKLEVLQGLLAKPGFDKVLVFGRTKHGVDKLAKKLAERGIAAESIHGNKTQNKRQKALDLFKRDRVQVLIATDVAARGLDISDVSHVINYDLPQSREDYIHRIGRTGRAGKRGSALTFIDA